MTSTNALTRKCILGMTVTSMKFIIGFLSIVAAAIVVFFATVAFSGLAIAAANSWILGGNFSDAWSSVWSRKFVVFGWSILFLGPISFRSASSR